MLPGKQEAQEVARGDRVDFRAQTPDRVPMNAGQEPPVAPLLVVDARNEASSQDRAFRFQRREGASRRGRRDRCGPGPGGPGSGQPASPWPGSGRARPRARRRSIRERLIRSACRLTAAAFS